MVKKPAKAKAPSSAHSIKVSKEAHERAKRLIDKVSAIGWNKLGVSGPAASGPVTISALFELGIAMLEDRATGIEQPHSGRDDA